MAVYAPNTDLRLLSAPLTFGDGNQLDFASATAQHDYFAALPGRNFTDFTYQRKDNVIRIPDLAENLYQYNYVMYQNFAGKWIYAFITRIEFINQNCTHVQIKTDVFQTWQFDFTFKQCLVVREHTESDLPFEHTLPESIETGEVREIYRHRATPYSLSAKNTAEFDANYRVIFCLSESWGSTELVANMYGGVPKTAYYYGFDRDQVRAATHSIVQAHGADSIIAVYPVPIGALNWSPVEGGYDNVQYYLPYDRAEQTVTIPIARSSPITGLGNFRNMKCLCYPYHFYRIWSANGDSVDIRPEDITSAGSRDLVIESVLSGAVCPSIILTPRYYKYNGYGEQPGNGENFAYSVNFSDFPQIAVKTSVYENFIALNQNALTMSKIRIGVDAVRGMTGLMSNPTQVNFEDASLPGVNIAPNGGVNYAPGSLPTISKASAAGVGGAINAGVSAAMQSLSIAAHMRDLERQPDHIKGTPQGNALMLTGGGGVFVSEFAVKNEYLAIVDDYFTQYGYYVHSLKTPQYTSRVNHNYLETRFCDISGEMPQDDADELCAMFNAGLTVWHNPATFGNYSPDNSPL